MKLLRFARKPKARAKPQDRQEKNFKRPPGRTIAFFDLP